MHLPLYIIMDVFALLVVRTINMKVVGLGILRLRLAILLSSARLDPR